MILCPWNELPRYAPLLPGLEEAMAKVATLTSWETATYPLSGGNRLMVMSGTTMAADGGHAEAHRQYVDIQYLLAGQEVVGWAPLSALTPAVPFDEGKDIGFYDGDYTFVTIPAGHCYVAFPEDGHLPGRHLNGENNYTKIVVKLKV